VKYETVDEYRRGIDHIMSQGCSVTGIVCDGRKGLFQAFPGIPIQMCQFHQKQIITRYLTDSPKLQAGVELHKIVDSLTTSCEEVFSMLIEIWIQKWDQFLKEKTYSETGKWFYTHKRLRSAVRSLKSNLPYLFTYHKYPELHIPNTTNSLEGVNSAIKSKIKIHQGIKPDRRQKIIDYLLAK
jgi:transposase-like protein